MKKLERKQMDLSPNDRLNAIIDRYKERNERTSSLSLDWSSDGQLLKSMISSYTWRNSAVKSQRAVFADIARPSGIIRVPKTSNKL